MQGEMKFPQLTQYSTPYKNAFHKSGARGRFFWFLTPMLSYLLTVLLISSSNALSAQALVPSQAPTAQTTLAIFTDRKAPPIPDDLWSELTTALHEELASGSPEIQSLVSQTISPATDKSSGTAADSHFQIIRGDQIVPGFTLNNSITVYLHGECRIIPQPSPVFFRNTQVSGTLGWVKSDHGHIESFIHVDCTRLGQMLATQAFGLNRNRRDQLLASAIARVILHEWIHIATQNPHHSEHGITKAQFGVVDLLARASKPVMQQGQPALNSPSQSHLRGTE